MESNLTRLGLGTWAFGGRAYGPMADETALGIARRAYELGIRFFDTAHLYANGRSEELLGEAIGNSPDAKICTKLGYQVVDGKAQKNYDPEHLSRCPYFSITRARKS